MAQERRCSSIAADIDAAIERVVAHFEDNDVALRMDVLRGLTVQAKLAFETERVKERLRQHPATQDLIASVTTQSKVFQHLYDGLAVEAYSCEYDRMRNAEINATVRWDLKDAAAKAGTSSSKKARKQSNKPVTKRRRVTGSLWTQYAFSRTLNEESETIIEFSISVAVGQDGESKPLVRYAMACDSQYPRSYYEDEQMMDSDEEGDADDGEEEEEVGSDDRERGHHADEKDASESEDEPSAEAEPGSEDDADNAITKEGTGDEEEEKDLFGEQIRGFEFDDTVLDEICDWLNAEAKELDLSDVIGFFLALPFYEDDWTVDERICQILFNAEVGSGDEEEMEGDEEDEKNDDDEQEHVEDDDDSDSDDNEVTAGVVVADMD